MKLIASGIFIWDSTERRSNRYGTFNMVDSNYNQDVTAEVFYDMKEIENLLDKKVKLTAIVRENRESGHIGDHFLGVFPSKPELNEPIEIGIGFLDIEKNACGMALGLIPNDKRNELWLDPRILYRLHDQTVEILAEITTEPNHIVQPFNIKNEDGVIFVDNGLVQSKGKNIVGAEMKATMTPVPEMEGTFMLERKLVPLFKKSNAH